MPKRPSAHLAPIIVMAPPFAKEVPMHEIRANLAVVAMVAEVSEHFTLRHCSKSQKNHQSRLRDT